jgi:hypothetical protein
MNVFHLFVIFLHRAQRPIEKSFLPKLSRLAPPHVDADHRTLFDGLKYGGNGERVRRMDDGVPVVGKEYPGGEQKAMFLAHAGERIRQAGKVSFVQLRSPRQEFHRNEQEAVIEERPAQTRHGDNLRALASGRNPKGRGHWKA